MERGERRDDRQGRDSREHRPRYERDRSRSPAHRERRDDRRRDHSPFRPSRGRGGGRGGGAGPPYRSDRDRPRDRQASHTPPPPSQPNNRGGRGGARQAFDNRPNGAGPRGGGFKQAPRPEVKMELLDGEDEEAMLARIMGFQVFKTTKNTKVPGNDKNYAVNKVKKAEYRQYMNRVGGFNRPLSPSRV